MNSEKSKELKGTGKLKKAVKAAVFLFLLFVLLLHFAYVVRQVDFRYNKSMFPSFYNEPENSIDIVTVGSSADYQYFNTPVLYEKFGYTSFNLSTALQPPAAAAYIMTEAEKRQNPQLYIVEVREFIHLSEKNRVKALYCVADSMDLSLNKWRMICHGYEGLWDRITAFADIVKYHGSWAGIDEKALRYWDNRVENKNKCWNGKSTVKPQTPPEEGTAEEVPLKEHNETELRFLLEECRKKGREVLFVATPFVYDDEFQGRALTLQKIVESYGYRFLNLSRGEEYGVDFETDYYNPNHVNKWGAEKVTIALGEYIKKEYNIETQHTGAVKADWDAYAAGNRESMEKGKERDGNSGGGGADEDGSVSDEMP